MKHVATYLIIVVALLLMTNGWALAEAGPADAEFSPVPTMTPGESPDPSAEPTSSQQPTVEPGANATPAPAYTPSVSTTPTPVPEDAAQRMLDELALSVDSISIELDMNKAQRVRIAELDVLGLNEDISCDWYISSHTGDAVEIELEAVEGSQGVYVYAVADAAGQSEYEITCRCAIGSASRELGVHIAVNVSDSSEVIPAKFEGIELIYQLNAGDKVKIEPANIDSFPQGTQWSLTSRKAGLTIEGANGRFEVSALRSGRYVALLTATAPDGESRMAYIMFEIGDGNANRDMALNFSSLEITLDMYGATTEAAYFIQPSDSLAYLPTEWTLTADEESGAAELRLEPMVSGAMLYAVPVAEGADQYTLTCHIPSLDQSTSIPVSVKVRNGIDGMSGIALKKAQYTLGLDEAITLSPYVLPQGQKCPEGTLWTAYQIGDSGSHLSLNVNGESGQTTILAYRPGKYTIEFAAQLSANRIYTTTVELIVTK